MQQDQNIKSIHNFSLKSKVDLSQYFQNGDQTNRYYVSANKDGSVLVVLIQKQVSFQLLHYIFEESQYKLIHEQQQTNDLKNEICNIFLNDQGNLLIIAYNLNKYHRYYKKARYQKWTKFTHEQYHSKQINQLNPTSIIYFFNQSRIKKHLMVGTSFDLSIICLSNNEEVIVKNFNVNRNSKMIYKCLFKNTMHSLVCKQENFLIILSEFQIFFYSIKPQNFLKQLQELKNPKGCLKMKMDSQLKLYILSKGSLQIYERKENQKYCFSNFIKLEEKTIQNFNVVQNTIFFFIYDINEKFQILKAFQIDQDKLINNVLTQWSLVQIFQNHLGFIVVQNNSLSVFKLD